MTAELVLSNAIRVLPLRTPTLPPATTTNAILVGHGEAVLVEPASPWEDEIERLVQWIATARDRDVRVRALLLTHHHVDHVGGAVALRDRLSLPIFAHEATKERLGAAIPIDRVLEDDEILALGGATLRAIHTPGHAPGHLCFFEQESRVMVAGDMVASEGTILVEPEDGDMQLYLASLAKMRDLDAACLVPAHGAPITNAAAHIDGYVAHRLAREAKVLAALDASPKTASELVVRVYADVPTAIHPLATLSLEAHLVKLAREGRATRVGHAYRLAS